MAMSERPADFLKGDAKQRPQLGEEPALGLPLSWIKTDRIRGAMKSLRLHRILWSTRPA